MYNVYKLHATLNSIKNFVFLQLFGRITSMQGVMGRTQGLGIGHVVAQAARTVPGQRLELRIVLQDALQRLAQRVGQLAVDAQVFKRLLVVEERRALERVVGRHRGRWGFRFLENQVEIAR